MNNKKNELKMDICFEIYQLITGINGAKNA